MIGWRDYVGVALVAAAALVGVGVAVAAYQLGSPVTAAPSVTGAAATQAAEESLLGHGDREMGRLAFRVECQDCHTQGRQSFDPAARRRARLLSARIREGVGEMPPFSSERLPDATLSHILAYIATPSGPEPTPMPEPRIRGVNFEVLEAEGRPSAPASVLLRIRDDAGATIAPSEMSALNLTIGGPTVDYQWARREDARRAQSLPDGSARYTFTARLPGDASGTYAVATEGYVEHPAGPARPEPVRDVGYNVVFYFGVSDPTPVPPRSVVTTETCNTCHGVLALHGGTRRNTEFCVMCHHSAQTDIEKRTTAGGPPPPETVLFRNLIHRIHTGEDLEQPFIIYGGAPANPQPIDLRAVHAFPGDRANCNVCHQPGTFGVSPALERSAPMTVEMNGETVRQVPPVTAACIGCHDSARAVAHAVSQSPSHGVETCATCHGPGRPFSVGAVHRLSSGR